MYQLPGPTLPGQVLPARRSPFLPLVILWLLLLAGFGAYRYFTQRAKPPAAAPVPTAAANLPKDAGRHVSEALEMTARLQTDLRASRRTLLRALEDDGTGRQTRRLQSALEYTEASEQEAGRLKAELEFIRATLEGEKQ